MSTWRTVAWLTDEGDYAFFQLDRKDGIEPETYAIEKSNPLFTLIWHRLEVALASRRSVLPLPSWPNSDSVDYAPDGKIVVRTVII
jgi:hypothetical protein